MNASQIPARTGGLAPTHLEAFCAPAELGILGSPVKPISMTVLQVSAPIKQTFLSNINVYCCKTRQQFILSYLYLTKPSLLCPKIPA